jgi:hypothetical protein
MKEMARFDIEKSKDEHRLLKILGSNGYAVKLMDITDHGVWTCKLVVVYEKEDK